VWQGALWDLLQPLVHADGVTERLTNAMCKPADQQQMCRVRLRVYTTVCSAWEVDNNKPAPFWKIRMQFGTPMPSCSTAPQCTAAAPWCIVCVALEAAGCNSVRQFQTGTGDDASDPEVDRTQARGETGVITKMYRRQYKYMPHRCTLHSCLIANPSCAGNGHTSLWWGTARAGFCAGWCSLPWAAIGCPLHLPPRISCCQPLGSDPFWPGAAPWKRYGRTRPAPKTASN
jgi:hypothetical protein